MTVGSLVGHSPTANWNWNIYVDSSPKRGLLEMPESIQSVRSMKLYTLQPFCDNVIRACLAFLFCFVSTLVQPIEQALSRKYSMNQLKRTSWLILFLVLSNFFCKLEKKKNILESLVGTRPSVCQLHMMANLWEKIISILAGNLNLGRSYLITTV